MAAPEPNPQPADEQTRRHRRPNGFSTGFATVRDVVSFVAGLAVVGHEVFVAPQAEPAAIGVGVMMMGLPLVFGADERRGRTL